MRAPRERQRQVRLTPRFERALVYAVQLHARQTRKGTDRPYIGHLLGTTALVLEHGGDEDEAIAALLHDAAEDQGGRKTLAEIARRFGRRVARIVDGCTDSYRIPRPPWLARKKKYLAHIRRAPVDVRLVSAADKLDNAREILADYRAVGEKLWSRFTGGRDGTLWYYRAVVEVLRAAGTNRLVDEFARTVAELEQRAAAEGSLRHSATSRARPVRIGTKTGEK